MTLTVETWCEALESGRYQQAPGSLRDGDSFCCLGVACDLSAIGEWDGNEYATTSDEGVSFSDDSDLPFSVMRAFGLSTEDGRFDLDSLPADVRAAVDHETSAYAGARGTASLMGLNDHGVTFATIAKVIRARPKGLFVEVE